MFLMLAKKIPKVKKINMLLVLHTPFYVRFATISKGRYTLGFSTDRKSPTGLKPKTKEWLIVVYAPMIATKQDISEVLLDINKRHPQLYALNSSFLERKFRDILLTRLRLMEAEHFDSLSERSFRRALYS